VGCVRVVGCMRGWWDVWGWWDVEKVVGCVRGWWDVWGWWDMWGWREHVCVSTEEETTILLERIRLPAYKHTISAIQPLGKHFLWLTVVLKQYPTLSFSFHSLQSGIPDLQHSSLPMHFTTWTCAVLPTQTFHTQPQTEHCVLSLTLRSSS